jgi:outer membrane biosynthesis protein TonB
MSATALRGPYDERESTTHRWMLIFVLISLLVHAIVIALVLLITRFMPVPKFAEPKAPPSVTLTLLPTPRPAAVQPKQKPIFIPTKPQQDVKPQIQKVESANDTVLQTHAKEAHNPDSILPETEGRPHAPNLVTAPEIRAPDTPEVSSTPPVPKQAKPTKPQPPTPKPQQGTQKPSDATKPMPPKPTPPKPTPAIDPETGLPILPPIAAQTMAPPDSAAQPLAPAPSQQQQAASVHGAMGRNGENSPAAMATELGKYKQYVYSVVGSYWYPDINQHFTIIPVGVVHIQFTIHSDGTISDVVILEGDNLSILRDISKNSLVKPAPFKPFSPAMIKEVGDSYTDDFSFSVY